MTQEIPAVLEENTLSGHVSGVLLLPWAWKAVPLLYVLFLVHFLVHFVPVFLQALLGLWAEQMGQVALACSLHQAAYHEVALQWA